MNFKKKILGLAFLSTVGLTANIGVAHAVAGGGGWPVADNNMLFYVAGYTNGGNGMIELLASINSALVEGNSINKNNTKNELAAKTELDGMQRIADAKNKHIPDKNACRDASTATGGGGGTVNTSKSGYGGGKSASISIEKPKSEHLKFDDLSKSRPAAELCSANDAKYGVSGCGRVGKFAGADESAVTSILYPPLTTAQQQAGIVPMGGLNEEQQAVRLQTIRTLVGVEALEPIQNENQSKTLEGQKYDALRRQANLRKTLAAGMMLKNSAIENQMANTDSDLLRELNWNSGDSQSPKAVWNRVFGNKVVFPEKPSEWDILTYYVYSRYADYGDKSFQIELGSMDDSDVLKNIARMDAISLRLQMLQVENQRNTNELLATILAQLVESKTDAERKIMRDNLMLTE